MINPIDAYIPIFITVGAAIFLSTLLTVASRALGPWRPDKIKTSVYESGMDPVGEAHQRFSIKFYLVAMLFILFDIEIIFMYPWAVQFKQLTLLLGAFPLVEMMIFVAILFVGFIYVFKKGGLDWE